MTTPPVQVLIESNVPTSQRGGAALHREQMVGALGRVVGVEVVDVLAPPESSAGSTAGVVWARLRYQVSLVARLWRLRHRADVVVTRLGLINIVPLLGRIFGLPVVVEVNGPVSEEIRVRPHLPMARALAAIVRSSEFLQLRFARGIRAVTPGLAEYSRRRSGSGPAIAVIQNGAEVQSQVVEFVLPSFETGEVRLNYAGALAPWYSFAPLLSFLTANSEASLRVRGDGPTRADLERQVSDLGLGDRVQVLKWGSAAEMAADRANADVVVVPLVQKSPHTQAVGSPLKLFELLALPVAVLATTVDGCDVEAPGLFKYDGNSVPDFSRAVAEVARSGGETIRRPVAQFSWDRRAEDFAELLIAVVLDAGA